MCPTVKYYFVLYSAPYRTVLYNTMQCSIVHYSTTLYCTVLYSTTLYCTVLYSTLYCPPSHTTSLLSACACSVMAKCADDTVHCIANTVQYCTVQYCTAVPCTANPRVSHQTLHPCYYKDLPCGSAALATGHRRNFRQYTTCRCTVHCCTLLSVLYCTVFSVHFYCNVQYCTVQYRIVLYCTVQFSTILYCLVLYSSVQYCTVQWQIGDWYS